MRCLPAFAGHTLDRVDHLRGDADKLTALHSGGEALLLALDGVLPVIDDAGGLSWTGLDRLAPDADTVFLGLDKGRPIFAVMPEVGDVAPASAQPTTWQAVAGLSPSKWRFTAAPEAWSTGMRGTASAPVAASRRGLQRDCPACQAQHFPPIGRSVGQLVGLRHHGTPPRSA